MKLSSKYLTKNVNIETKQNEEESQNCFHRSPKKKISVQNDNFKKKIFQKLNEGTVLNYITQSEKRESTKTTLSRTSNNIKYELSMINKYNEDLDNNLSFISEFDLEEEKNKDSSFNSSDDDNNVEETDIFKKSKEKIFFDKDKEEFNLQLEEEWNDITKFLSNKKII